MVRPLTGILRFATWHVARRPALYDGTLTSSSVACSRRTRDARPRQGLVYLGGAYYGTTRAGGAHDDGTIFKLAGAKKTIVHNFGVGTDGRNPYSALLNINGVLYGTTTSGGTHNEGAIFKFSGTTETVVHDFNGDSDGIDPTDAPVTHVGSTIYGDDVLRWGAWRRNVVQARRHHRDGAARVRLAARWRSPYGGVLVVGSPYGGVLVVGNAIYGTTEVGGTHAAGTVFKYAAGKLTILHSFESTAADGKYPYGDLVNDAGTSRTARRSRGGKYNVRRSRRRQRLPCSATPRAEKLLDGTVFKIAAGKLTVLFSFGVNASDGSRPYGGLILEKGTLYGTTAAGGAGNGGTVYKLAGTTETQLHAFPASAGDGAAPFCRLLDVNGKLYGTTEQGGSAGVGTIFELPV